MDLSKPKRLGGRFQDMTGRVFGKWTVLRLHDRGGTNGHAIWICQCWCGVEKKVRSNDLRSGKSEGCPKCKGASLQEKFEAGVRRSDGCWEWDGWLSPSGYGMIFHRGHHIGAHRVAYELHYGVAPGDLQVCHHCDNPPCVRPDHLFLGTQKDNVHDMMRKGRRVQGDVCGSKNGNATLTESQVAEIRRRYAAGGVRQVDLAAEYGVPQTSISSIVRRKQWTHVA